MQNQTPKDEVGKSSEKSKRTALASIGKEQRKGLLTSLDWYLGKPLCWLDLFVIASRRPERIAQQWRRIWKGWAIISNMLRIYRIAGHCWKTKKHKSARVGQALYFTPYNDQAALPLVGICVELIMYWFSRDQDCVDTIAQLPLPLDLRSKEKTSKESSSQSSIIPVLPTFYNQCPLDKSADSWYHPLSIMSYTMKFNEWNRSCLLPNPSLTKSLLLHTSFSDPVQSDLHVIDSGVDPEILARTALYFSVTTSTDYTLV